LVIGNCLAIGSWLLAIENSLKSIYLILEIGEEAKKYIIKILDYFYKKIIKT
jgi:hypothetical protein